MFGIIVACTSEGLNVGGVSLDADKAAGAMNYFKSMEGFLESTPQAIFQLAITMRSYESFNDVSKSSTTTY